MATRSPIGDAEARCCFHIHEFIRQGTALWLLGLSLSRHWVGGRRGETV